MISVVVASNVVTRPQQIIFSASLACSLACALQNLLGTPRTNARMGRVDRDWTKSGGRLFHHGQGFC